MALKTKTFSNGLVVKHRKSAIILETAPQKNPNQDNYKFAFPGDALREFCDYIETAAEEAWIHVTPKVASSEASDYYEYYDKKYDNNGYLQIRGNTIDIDAPFGSRDTLYQFNKPKIQSFLFDLKQKVAESEA